MGGRAVLGVLLGVALVAAAVSFSRCLPRPGDDVEWVRREDAIIVQMKTASGADVSNVVPDFTLYGDGTLLFARPDEAGHLRLQRANLAEPAVRDLLEFIAGTGFMDFSYEQPRPERATSRPTTFIYAQTMLAANAVSAYALDSALAEGEGQEWRQFRRLQEISRRLESLDPLTLDAKADGEFVPEALLLVVEETGAPDTAGSPIDWPLPAIDLNAIAPPGAGRVQLLMDGPAAAALLAGFTSSGLSVPLIGPYRERDRFFFVGYRPVLPYEDNFPEFEPPP